MTDTVIVETAGADVVTAEQQNAVASQNVVASTIESENGNSIITAEESSNTIESAAENVVVQTTTELQILTEAQQGPAGVGGGGSGLTYENVTESQTLTSDDSNTVYTNTGATEQVVSTLPAAALGLFFKAIVTDVLGQKFKATNGDRIRVGGSESSINGTFTCTQIGGSLELYGTDDGLWVGESTRTWINA